MKTIALLLFFALSLPALSYTLGSKTIKKVNVNLTSGVYFQTTETMENPHECGGSSSTPGWYQLMKGGSYEKEAYSLLLAAKLSGKDVTFSIEECHGSYPKVTYIYIDD